MSYKFDVQITPAVMRDAWNAYFFRGRFWLLGVAVALLLVPVALDLSSGSLSSMSIFALSAFGLTVVLLVMTYFTGLRRSLSKLEAIVDGKASYTLTEETIEAVSSLGSISLSWSAVAELRKYRESILVGFRGAMYSTIPASQIPADALAFMVERCSQAGAKLTDIGSSERK